MAGLNPLTSLSAAREKAIQDLSTLFAHDNLTLEELERRLERAYRATTVAELQALTGTTGVPAPFTSSAMPIPALAGQPLDRDKIVSIMSETKRQGLWAVPQHLDVYAIMADTTLDLTRAVLPAGVVDIQVRVLMASAKIILPPGIRVVSRVSNFMSSVGSDDDESAGLPVDPGATVIRISGWVTMADFKTFVRRRERTY